MTHESQHDAARRLCSEVGHELDILETHRASSEHTVLRINCCRCKRRWNVTTGTGGTPLAEPTTGTLQAFLTDLSTLTRLHGLEIGGCACHGSPWIDPATSLNPGAEKIADGLVYSRVECTYTVSG